MVFCWLLRLPFCVGCVLREVPVHERVFLEALTMCTVVFVPIFYAADFTSILTLARLHGARVQSCQKGLIQPYVAEKIYAIPHKPLELCIRASLAAVRPHKPQTAGRRNQTTAERSMLRSLKLLLGILSVHGFAPPMPRVDRRSVSRHFDAASAAADILADPTARFEAATVVLLASFASAGSAEVKKVTPRHRREIVSTSAHLVDVLAGRRWDKVP